MHVDAARSNRRNTSMHSKGRNFSVTTLEKQNPFSFPDTHRSLQVAQVTGGRGACSEVSVRELWPRGCAAAGPGASGPGWGTPGSGSRLLPQLPSCPCTAPAPPWSSSAASPAPNLHKPFWKWGNFRSFHHKRSECRNNCFFLSPYSFKYCHF